MPFPPLTLSLSLFFLTAQSEAASTRVEPEQMNETENGNEIGQVN